MLSPQHRNLKIGGYHMQFYYIIATVDQKLPQDHEQTDYKLLVEIFMKKAKLIIRQTVRITIFSQLI